MSEKEGLDWSKKEELDDVPVWAFSAKASPVLNSSASKKSRRKTLKNHNTSSISTNSSGRMSIESQKTHSMKNSPTGLAFSAKASPILNASASKKSHRKSKNLKKRTRKHTKNKPRKKSRTGLAFYEHSKKASHTSSVSTNSSGRMSE